MFCIFKLSPKIKILMTSTYHMGLLLLRLSFSGLLLTHGIPKLMHMFQGNLEFADPIGVGSTVTFLFAVLAEAICPMLIIIGYKTRLAAIPIIITMAVGAFIHHASDPVAVKEKALLYLFGFVVIALVGAGKFSVDKK